jgi:hypothetical protein
VVFEKLNESLTDHTGCAEDAYVTPFHLTRVSQALGDCRSKCSVSKSGCYTGRDTRPARLPQVTDEKDTGVSMLRIGVMLDSWTTSAWVAKIIEDIQSSEFASVSVVILNTPAEKAKTSFRKRLKNHWKLTLYHRYEHWDYLRRKTDPDAKSLQDVSSLLSEAQVIPVKPIRKGFTDQFSEDDLANIRNADLDVVFRFGFRIIRGGILQTARYGVWSFHHGDNLEYRGGPPLFWEIYEENPVSGTILQILTDSLDGGHVLYRSHSATDFTSLYGNRNPIYWKTAEFAMRRLRDLNARGWSYIQSLDTYNEKVPYTRRLYRTPDALQMAVFLWRFALRSLRTKISSRWKGGQRQWFVAMRRRSPEHRFDDAAGYLIRQPPMDRFYADPFLIKREGRNYLFFEDYRYSEHRALICCSEVAADGTLKEPVEVLRRPYHLSYPFLFEDDGHIYMIPETKQNRTVELYRADEFPYRWSLAAVLLKDIFVVDATIHKADGKFWMFAGLSNGKYSNSEELGLFYANSLLGPWRPHCNNPVVSDVRRARPAGALFYQDGKLIRPSQDCSKAYGYALCFSEVTVLNEGEYCEVPISRIEPDWVRDNLGTHTYSRTDDFEAIDGNFASKGRS